MGIPLFQVDAFANEIFHGNPAGVCLLDAAREDHWMQSLAMEMNLSETAFVLPEGDGYRLRWFTPAAEVDLCGHATLATAHTLWATGRLRPDEQARFYTRSGLLTARRAGEWIELNFPATPPAETEAPAGLLAALGLSEALFIGRSKFDYLVEVADEAVVRGLSPDFGALNRVEARGVMVTARGSGGYDFISRFFAPRVGVNEDPVTGSAHCCLTPYWSSKLGRTELKAFQASRRGGELRLRLEGERVVIAGQAVTVFASELD